MEQVRGLFWAIDKCITNDFRYYHRYAFCFVLFQLYNCNNRVGTTVQKPARNKKFFRVGRVSWNQGTSINIYQKPTKNKTPQEKIWSYFFQMILKLHFYSKDGHSQGIRFPKSRHFFEFSKKGKISLPATSLTVHLNCYAMLL